MSSKAARPLGRTAATLAVEWTSRTPCVGNETSSILKSTNKYDRVLSRTGYVRELVWITTTMAGRVRKKVRAVGERHPEEVHVPPALLSGPASPAVGGTSSIRDVRRRLCSHQILRNCNPFLVTLRPALCATHDPSKPGSRGYGTDLGGSPP